jgi:hypothetical protein
LSGIVTVNQLERKKNLTLRLITRLQRGRELIFKNVRDYECRLIERERVSGTLLPEADDWPRQGGRTEVIPLNRTAKWMCTAISGRATTPLLNEFFLSCRKQALIAVLAIAC